MRRTDRLFDLIQILRDGRLHNAAEMAAELEVSDRTIWRDMATLMASGLPIEGERGVGYILRAPITLPPMVLTSTELEAFRLGVRLVAEGADPGLARAARSLATKIGAVTPTPPDGDDDGLFVFTGRETTRAAPHMPMLRAAIRDPRTPDRSPILTTRASKATATSARCIWNSGAGSGPSPPGARRAGFPLLSASTASWPSPLRARPLPTEPGRDLATWRERDQSPRRHLIPAHRSDAPLRHSRRKSSLRAGNTKQRSRRIISHSAVPALGKNTPGTDAIRVEPSNSIRKSTSDSRPR